MPNPALQDMTGGTPDKLHDRRACLGSRERPRTANLQSLRGVAHRGRSPSRADGNSQRTGPPQERKGAPISELARRHEGTPLGEVSELLIDPGGVFAEERLPVRVGRRPPRNDELEASRQVNSDLRTAHATTSPQTEVQTTGCTGPGDTALFVLHAASLRNEPRRKSAGARRSARSVVAAHQAIRCCRRASDARR